MNIVQIISIALGSIWALWIFYTAMMRLKMVRDAGKLTKAQTVFGYPALVIGLVLDAFVNIVFGSILFIELPREWTLSSRLWRLSNDANHNWRQQMALAFRVTLLDSIDPSGIHRG